METMLSKMAWAMAYRWALDDYEEDEARKTADVDWPDWIEVAKAALTAIMEPSEGQLDRACEIGPDTNNGPFSYDDASSVWKAMIQSILSEEG